MHRKISLGWLLLAVNIIGAIIIFFLPVDLPSSPAQGSTAVTQKNISSAAITIAVKEVFELPVRIKIPKIGVDATLESVGLTKLGAIDSPKIPANAAWFNLGPRPGEKGVAVIDGHFGWKNGIHAVFDDLHTLKKGDKIYIKGENGTTTTFVVSKLQSFKENESFAAVFNGNDGKSHLNLITCGGVYSKAKKSYSNRVVAFADAQ